MHTEPLHRITYGQPGAFYTRRRSEPIMRFGVDWGIRPPCFLRCFRDKLLKLVVPVSTKTYSFHAALRLITVALFFYASPTIAESRIPLTFGILPVIDTLPFLVGVEKGFFAHEGIDLKIFSFSSALERDTAFQSGRIDGYFGDLLNTLLLINSGRSLSIVSTVIHTRPDQRMFALLASPKSGITGITQAGTEQIAISRASVIEYVLDRMLAEKGVDSQSVKKTEIRAIPIRYQMLMADKIKLAVLPEPLVTQAESQGARVIADDRRLDMPLTVFAFNKAFLETHPGVAGRFLRAYKRAVESVNRQPDAFKGLLVEKTQLPPSIKDLFKVPTFPVSERPTGRDVGEAEDWLLKNRLIAKPIPFGSVVMH